MNENPSVLMVTSDFLPNSGGIAAHVHYLANALERKGCTIEIISASFDKNPNKNNKIITHHINIRKIKYIRPAVILLHMISAFRAVKIANFDIIHIHVDFPDLITIPILRLMGAKNIVFTNHNGTLIRKDRYRTLLIRKSLEKLSGVISPSRELHSLVEKIKTNNVENIFIPNGVDVDKFFPADRLMIREKIVLATRRHTEKCGIQFLVESIPAVVNTCPDVKFIIAGSGPLTGDLQNRVRELRVEDYVSFIGNKSHDEIGDLYRDSYMTVLPSLYEAVSLSGLEALACGSPVVGSNVGGIPEFVIDKETGILVEPGNSVELSKAIVNLIKDEESRLKYSLNGRKLVEDRFSWLKIAEDTIDFYNKIMLK